jgi:hypothetical protein
MGSTRRHRIKGVAMTDSLSDDLLTGAQAIAAYLGAPWNERKVYYAAEQKHLPIGHIGQTLFSRKSALDRALTPEAA